MKRLCVFCGSSSGADPGYVDLADRLGTLLARQGVGLVFGGGSIGLMGRVADAVLAAGGNVIGVIPQALVARELAHTGPIDLRIVGSMHERKALMAELADAFVALPGGLGTLEELCEALTWTQLGIHDKPCGLLNFRDYFRPLLSFLDHAVAECFMRPEYRAMVIVEEDPERLLAAMRGSQPPRRRKWLDREEA